MNIFAVIGEGSHSALFHICHFDQFGPLHSFGDCANRQDMRITSTFSLPTHEFNEGPIINHGLRVSHGQNRRKSSAHCSARATQNILFIFLAWFSQVSMYINESRENNLSSPVDFVD